MRTTYRVCSTSYYCPNVFNTKDEARKYASSRMMTDSYYQVWPEFTPDSGEKIVGYYVHDEHLWAGSDDLLEQKSKRHKFSTLEDAQKWILEHAKTFRNGSTKNYNIEPVIEQEKQVIGYYVYQDATCGNDPKLYVVDAQNPVASRCQQREWPYYKPVLFSTKENAQAIANQRNARFGTDLYKVIKVTRKPNPTTKTNLLRNFMRAIESLPRSSIDGAILDAYDKAVEAGWSSK